MQRHWRDAAVEVLLLAQCFAARFQPDHHSDDDDDYDVDTIDDDTDDDDDDEANLTGPNNKACWLLFPLFSCCSTAVPWSELLSRLSSGLSTGSIIIRIINRIIIRIINRIRFVKIIRSCSTAVTSNFFIGIIYDVLEEVMSKHFI